MEPRDSAFRSLCEREYPRLVGALGLYTGDAGVAEELAQEALARAWRHWGKVSRADDAGAWLFVTGFNLAKSHLRRVRAERRARSRFAADRSPADVDQASAHDLRRALAELPQRYRSVLVLRYYGGYSLQEVADHLEVPLPTVKTWSARGLASLRQHAPTSLKEVSDVS